MNGRDRPRCLRCCQVAGADVHGVDLEAAGDESEVAQGRPRPCIC